MSLSYTPVTNLKLAATLSAFGVPLVPPTISRTRINTKHGPREVIGYFFASESLSHLPTSKIIKAWDFPELFVNEPPPFGWIPILKATMDNRDEWVAATKKLEKGFADFSVGNPSPLECEEQLRQAAKLMVPKITSKRGQAFSVLPVDAPAHIREGAAKILREGKP
jgi:hypothetical protein